MLAAAAAGGPGTTVRTSSSVFGGMLRYQEKGFTLAAEYSHVVGKIEDATGAGVDSGTGATDGKLLVNQLLLSGMYFF